MKNALEAVTAIRDAMAAAGLPRTSRYAGGELTGWTEARGSTGFSVREDQGGHLSWHVVVSGRPHMRYRSYRSDGDDLHEPIAPERLNPRIQAVFEGLGMEVLAVRYGGHQTMWDDDVEYDVVTTPPDWLESCSPSKGRTFA